MPAGEDGHVLRANQSDVGIGEYYGAVGITDRTNTDEGVCEGWENVDFGGDCGDLWEHERAHIRRLLDLTRGGTNTYCGSGRVYVSVQGTFIQEDNYGSTINNASVNKSKWGRHGRMWVRGGHRGRPTAFVR